MTLSEETDLGWRERGSWGTTSGGNKRLRINMRTLLVLA